MKKTISSVLLFIAVVLTALNIQAQGDVYYEQMDFGSGSHGSYYPADVEGDGPASPIQVTDNFTVREGEEWKIAELEVYGQNFNDILSFDLFIYEPALDDFRIAFPGEVYAAQYGLNFEFEGEEPSLYKIFLEEVITLPPGDYYISVVATMDYRMSGGQTDNGGFYWQFIEIPGDAPDGNAYESDGSGGWELLGFSDLTFRFRGPAKEAVIPVSTYGLVLGIGLILIFTLLTLRRFRA